MYVYLMAASTKEYDASAYSYMVGNFQIQSDYRFGWKVVEAYLHGFLDLSNFIIKKNLIPSVKSFDLCTPSKQIHSLIQTDRLEQLSKNNWKDPDGHVFYVPILQELNYHRLYYQERGVSWKVLTELDEMSYRSFDQCKTATQSLLSRIG